MLGIWFVRIGVRQVRHARSFSGEATPDDLRIARAMGILNSITHPVWMTASIVLLLLGLGRWVLPLMVAVIGLHFIPIALILGRKIDYFLGPVSILFAVVAGVFASFDNVPWLVVFAIAGIGGALSTIGYSFYMTAAYRSLCEKAGVPYPS